MKNLFYCLIVIIFSKGKIFVLLLLCFIPSRLKAQIITDPATGNVGIRTNTPGTALDVNGPIANNRNWLFLATAGDTNHAIGNIAGTDGEQFRFFNFLDLYQSASGSSRFYINSIGNIGFGTTNPTQPLTIPVTTNGNGISLGTYNTLSAGQFTFVGITGADGTFNGGNLSSADNGSAGFAVVHTGGGAGNSAELAFVTHNNGKDSRERVRIDRLGNTGMGTNAPLDRLDIAGESSYPGRILFGDGNNYTPYMKMIKWSGGGNNYLQTTIGNSLDVAGAISFQTGNGGGTIGNDPQTTRMIITQTGWVGIGTTTPREALSVNGNIRSKQVTVEVANWPDYVFKSSFQLKPLSEVKTYVDQNHHLPDMPSAAQVERDGLNLSEVNKLLTKKVEELTLYLIEKDEELAGQKRINDKQALLNQSLQADINELKSLIIKK